MKKINILMIVFVAMIIATLMSCEGPKWIQMSEKAMKDYNLPDSMKLKKLQYRIGPEGQFVELKRGDLKKKDTIENGTLTSKTDSTEHIEILKPKTPGIMKSSRGIVGKLFVITFSGDSLNLVFGPDPNGDYVLYTMNDNNKETIEYIYSNNQTVNKVKYGKHKYDVYDVIQGANGSAKLYFNTRDLKKLTKTKHRAKGEKVK
jgi:hypothetical protein